MDKALGTPDPGGVYGAMGRGNACGGTRPRGGAAAAYKIERRERPEGPWSIAGVEGTKAVRRVSEATEATVTSQERGK